MGVLEPILAAKRAALPELRRRTLPTPPTRRPLALVRPPLAPLRIIAEIKRRSPSAGVLSTKLSVAERAAAYARGGACLLSVLTDEPFFDGRYEDLLAAREACELPLLCKDFVIDESQLDAARAFGADAVLLIVRCLSDDELARLLTAARQRDLAALVEVTNEVEASSALQAGADLIGVNVRDLDTLKMDFLRAREVLGSLPPGVARVHLSGIGSARAVSEVAASAVDAALIGEALMRQDDPEPLLRSFSEAALISPRN